MKSKFLSLDLKDFGKSVVVFFLTTLLGGLYQLAEAGNIFDWAALQPVLITSVTATISYLIKNFLSNSDDKVLKKDLPK